VIIVRQQGSGDKVPEWVKETPVKLVTADKPYTVKEFKQGNIMECEIDKATGYRLIDGKKWAGAMTCASCNKQIPVKPHAVVVEPEGAPPPDEPPPEQESYTCPECGKEAMPQPDQEPPPPPPAN